VNKLFVILIVAIMAIVGVAIAYILRVAPAVQLVEAIQQQIGGLTSGFTAPELSLSTVASGASLATAATSTIGWIKSNKDKVLAQKEAIAQQVENSGLMEQYESLKNTKTDLESQLTQLKTDTKTELASYKDEVAKLKQENKNLQTSLDTLNSIVPKIQKEKEIIRVTN
jgi:chromosome segregation ATPase